MIVLPHDDIEHIRLWRAVLLQAFRDMLAVPKTAGTQAEYIECGMQRRLARSWLLNRSNDFDDVCALAALSPENVNHAARRLHRAIIQADYREAARIKRLVFATLISNPASEEGQHMDISQ